MTPIERATIIHYHRHRIREQGVGSLHALGWRAPASQHGRFEAISRAADFAHASVLDVGCGTGDLSAFLARRHAGLHYLGIDQVVEFIDCARERHGARPRTAFAVADFTHAALPQADFVVACGTLNYRSADPAFVFDSIDRLYAASRRALIFNLLDAAVFPEHPLLVGRDIAGVEAYCRTLGDDLGTVRDYADDDVTLVLRRRPDLPGASAGR